MFLQSWGYIVSVWNVLWCLKSNSFPSKFQNEKNKLPCESHFKTLSKMAEKVSYFWRKCLKIWTSKKFSVHVSTNLSKLLSILISSNNFEINIFTYSYKSVSFRSQFFKIHKIEFDLSLKYTLLIHVKSSYFDLLLYKLTFFSTAFSLCTSIEMRHLRLVNQLCIIMVLKVKENWKINCFDMATLGWHCLTKSLKQEQAM